MSRRPPRRTLLAPLLMALVALAAALPPAALARGREKPPTAPGKYHEWNGEIDELEILTPWKRAEYSRIVVAPFDVSEVKLPEAEDNTLEPVKKVLADPAAPFVEGLRADLKGGGEVAMGAAAGAPASSPASGAGGAKELLIRGKVLVLDPGSRAARYWGGFGAGAARGKISGELVDAASGAVLARFTQERRSGFGAFGGDYVKLMNKNLRAIGSDVAGLLNSF